MSHRYDLCACGNTKRTKSDQCRACWDARPRVAEHGTRSRYQAGCHCDDCRQANAEYHRRRRAGRGREVSGEAREFRIQLPAGWGL